MTKQEKLHLVELFPIVFSLFVIFVVVITIPIVIVIKGFATETVLPQNVIISNVSQNSFTVVFITDKPVVGSLLYGVGDKIDLTALDEAGFNPTYTHLVTASNLNPGKTYNFLIRTDSAVSGAGGGKPFTVILPPVSQSVPPAPRIATGALASQNAPGDFSDTVILLKSGERYLATRPDNTGSFLFTYTNFVGANGNYETLTGNTADVVYFRRSEAPQTFGLDLVNSKKVVSTKLSGKTAVGVDQLTVGEPAVPVNQSLWDKIREFFMSLITRLRGQSAAS